MVAVTRLRPYTHIPPSRHKIFTTFEVLPCLPWSVPYICENQKIVTTLKFQRRLLHFSLKARKREPGLG